MKGSWCRTLSSPWMSSSPPGPMGVPVTAHRWVLCRRPAMTATLPRPLPTICASSRTTRHQLQNKTPYVYAGEGASCCAVLCCAGLMLCSVVASCYVVHSSCPVRRCAVPCCAELDSVGLWPHAVPYIGVMICCAVLRCTVRRCATLCCPVLCNTHESCRRPCWPHLPCAKGPLPRIGHVGGCLEQVGNEGNNLCSL